MDVLKSGGDDGTRESTPRSKILDSLGDGSLGSDSLKDILGEGESSDGQRNVTGDTKGAEPESKVNEEESGSGKVAALRIGSGSRECNSHEVTDVREKKRKQKERPKTTRSVEMHNICEKRRRERIRERLKALQQLIPDSEKLDKASMLDKAISYLKYLKLQAEMMTMGVVPSSSMPLAMRPAQQPQEVPVFHPFSPFTSRLPVGTSAYPSMICACCQKGLNPPIPSFQSPLFPPFLPSFVTCPLQPSFVTSPLQPPFIASPLSLFPQAQGFSASVVGESSRTANREFSEPRTDAVIGSRDAVEDDAYEHAGDSQFSSSGII